VILAEVLGERKQRISKIKDDARKHSITCFVSDSVVSECNQKIVGATDSISLNHR